jgi:hypothetical protein
MGPGRLTIHFNGPAQRLIGLQHVLHRLPAHSSLRSPARVDRACLSYGRTNGGALVKDSGLSSSAAN